MQRLYRPSDVSICLAFWENYKEAAATVRSALALNLDVSLCNDGSLMGDGIGYTVRLPEKTMALNPCVPLNAAVNNSTRSVVVLTNPGVEIRAGMIERMLDVLDENTYVAAACRDFDTGRWLCHSTVKGGEHGRGPMPEGSGFHFLAMLTRSLWDRAGGFDEDYREGQGYDDNDFLWRLHRAGAKFKVLDDVVIDHKRSTTVWPPGGLERNRRLFESKWSVVA